MAVLASFKESGKFSCSRTGGRVLSGVSLNMTSSRSSVGVSIPKSTSDMLRVIPQSTGGSWTRSSIMVKLSIENDAECTRCSENISLSYSERLGSLDPELLKDAEYVDFRLGSLNKNIPGDTTSRLRNESCSDAVLDTILVLDSALARGGDSREGPFAKIEVMTF